MITIYYVRTWLRWLALATLALVCERALLGATWLCALAGVLTLLLFLILTCLMYADWRSARRAGVGYILRDINRG
jgi:hypothetical protein